MSGNVWSAAEDEYLRQHSNRSRQEVARELGRSLAAVERRVCFLGLTRVIRWTAAEDAFLCAHAGDKSHKEMALELGRARTAVSTRLAKLGLAKRVGRYTEVELAFVRDNISEMSFAQIGQALDRAEHTVASTARRYGWSRRQHLGWTAEEEQCVRDNYERMTYGEIAAVLHKQEKAVRAYARLRLGLSKPTGRPWSPHEDQFLRDNAAGILTLHQMGEQLERSWQAVGQRVRVLGFATNRKGGHWTSNGQHVVSSRDMGPNWQALRSETFDRDGWLCQHPGCQFFSPSGRKLHAHHIKPRKFGVDDRWLVTLCTSHHSKQPAHHWTAWTPERLPEYQQLIYAGGD